MNLNIIKMIVTFVFLIVQLTFSQNYGGWFFADSLNFARQYHSSVILDNDEVLVAGGEDFILLKSSEIYNREFNEWRFTDSLNIERAAFNLVKLQSGMVLAIGGSRTQSCEIYDPIAEKWTLTDSINTLRFSFMKSVLLNDGRVMIAGGFYFPSNYPKECELYDPLTGIWSITDSLNYGRAGHTMTLLNDGRGLVVGGRDSQELIEECEIYDPATGNWNIVASLNIPRKWHSATLLPDGKVLIAGGDSASTFSSIINDCEVYDPVLDEWNIVGSMEFPNAFHLGIVLGNNKILFTGGINPDVWEIYDYQFFQSVHNALMPMRLYEPTVHKLNTGEVINIGGWEYEFPDIFPSNKVLIYNPTIPVELISFTAGAFDNNVHLNWQTATELNNKGFEIQRKILSKSYSEDWEKIGFVEGYGTTTEAKVYSFIDKDVKAGSYSYRLKQIDFDGSFDYSNIIEVIVEVPEQFALYQNYPNPFNNSTVIRYTVTEKVIIQIKVYDMLGTEVAELVNETKTAGYYETVFDASSLSSGVYVYRITALRNDRLLFSQSKQMILLK